MANLRPRGLQSRYEVSPKPVMLAVEAALKVAVTVAQAGYLSMIQAARPGRRVDGRGGDGVGPGAVDAAHVPESSGLSAEDPTWTWPSISAICAPAHEAVA
jgi:hypothetical protein